MNIEKKGSVLALAVVLLVSVSVATVIAVGDVYVSNNRVLPEFMPPYASPSMSVLSNVELNASEGFNSSVLVAGQTSSPMLVLAPGGKGTVPFTVYSSANSSFGVSLTVYLGSNNATTYGVQFSLSPDKFTVNPGQQVTVDLTVTADKSASSAFYMPTIGIQANGQSGQLFLSGGPVALPALLVADYTPACLYLINEPEGVLAANWTLSNSTMTATISTSTSSASIVKIGLPVQPTINLAPGQRATVIVGCLTTDKPDLNVTAPTGLTAEFSSSPLNLLFSYCTGKMYPLTVTADSNLNSGSYQLNANGTLGSYELNLELKVAVS